MVPTVIKQSFLKTSAISSLVLRKGINLYEFSNYVKETLFIKEKLEDYYVNNSPDGAVPCRIPTDITGRFVLNKH